MKTWMKTTLAASLIAMSAVGAGAALARGGDCAGMQDKRGAHRMSAEQRAEQLTQGADLRLARLELALSLTPEQRPAWDEFAATVRERTERHGAAMAERGNREQPGTALDRLERMERMSEHMHASAVQTREAVANLYATLSDAQKSVFDADFSLSPRGERRGKHQHGERREHRKGPHRG
jgi:protein CpxP